MLRNGQKGSSLFLDRPQATSTTSTWIVDGQISCLRPSRLAPVVGHLKKVATHTHTYMKERYIYMYVYCEWLSHRQLQIPKTQAIFCFPQRSGSKSKSLPSVECSRLVRAPETKCRPRPIVAGWPQPYGFKCYEPFHTLRRLSSA